MPRLGLRLDLFWVNWLSERITGVRGSSLISKMVIDTHEKEANTTMCELNRDVFKNIETKIQMVPCYMWAGQNTWVA